MFRIKFVGIERNFISPRSNTNVKICDTFAVAVDVGGGDMHEGVDVLARLDHFQYIQRA
jgi:hypothetical protein